MTTQEFQAYLEAKAGVPLSALGIEANSLRLLALDDRSASLRLGLARARAAFVAVVDGGLPVLLAQALAYAVTKTAVPLARVAESAVSMKEHVPLRSGSLWVEALLTESTAPDERWYSIDIIDDRDARVSSGQCRVKLG